MGLAWGQAESPKEGGSCAWPPWQPSNLPKCSCIPLHRTHTHTPLHTQSLLHTPTHPCTCHIVAHPAHTRALTPTPQGETWKRLTGGSYSSCCRTRWQEGEDADVDAEDAVPDASQPGAGRARGWSRETEAVVAMVTRLEEGPLRLWPGTPPSHIRHRPEPPPLQART